MKLFSVFSYFVFTIMGNIGFVLVFVLQILFESVIINRYLSKREGNQYG